MILKTDSGCEFNNAQEIIDRVKSKNMHNVALKEPFKITCTCDTQIVMDTHVYDCPTCNKIYAVTPCSSDDINNVVSL